MSAEETGSYRLGEAHFRDASAELERLRVQAEVLWPAELAALERQGLRRDANVLEAGCGPGFVTSRLRHMEQAGVISAGLAARARDYLARVDSGEQPFEGMEIVLVVSGSA